MFSGDGISSTFSPCLVSGSAIKPYSVFLYERIERFSATSRAETSLIELMGTDAGAVIYQICLPSKASLAKRRCGSIAVFWVMVAASKPAGGLYGAAGMGTTEGVVALWAVNHCSASRAMFTAAEATYDGALEVCSSDALTSLSDSSSSSSLPELLLCDALSPLSRA